MSARFLSALLLAALSARADDGVVEIRPNREPLTVELRVTGDPGVVPGLRDALAFAIALSPPLALAQGAPSPRRLVRVEVARGQGATTARVVVVRGTGETTLDRSLSGAGTSRSLGFAIADLVRAHELGAAPLFASRIAAVQADARGGRELVTLDPGGGDVELPRRRGHHVASPAWSADGASLLFTSWEERPEIWRLDLASHRAAPAFALGARAGNPAASRDGAVAFSAWVDGRCALYVAPRGGAPAPVTLGGSIDALPSWGDGEVFFVSSRTGASQIFAVPAGGGPARRVSFLPGAEIQSVAVHPLGDRVAFAARARGDRFRIHVAPFEGGTGGRTLDLRREAVLPADDGCEATDASWSPGGALLVVAERCGATTRLVVATPDGTRRVRLPGSGLSSPAWGPARR